MNLGGNAFHSGCVAAELMATFCVLGAAYDLKDGERVGGRAPLLRALPPPPSSAPSQR